MLQRIQFPDAELLLQGAQLARFKDWLFFPSNPDFEAGKSFHGGVPVIFPWFGPKRDDPKASGHGWARTMPWTVESQSPQSIALSLDSRSMSGATGAWPFHVRLEYTFGDTLNASFFVRNEGESATTFECALHTYFAVSNVSEVEIEGLDGLTFIDKTQNYAREVQSGNVRFEGEVDRVYLDAPSTLRIRDGATGFELRGDWESAVTWNPGQDKGTAMSDLGADGWTRFVCLETGAIADNAVALGAGESWTMNMEVARL